MCSVLCSVLFTILAIRASPELSFELLEDEKTKASASIDSDARYDIVVKFTNDEFKLPNLKFAGEDKPMAMRFSLPRTMLKRRQQKRPEGLGLVER